MDLVNVKKPIEVTRAVNCLWLSLGLGAIKSWLDSAHLSAQGTPEFIFFVLLSVFVITVFIYIKISQGRNWARITYLILTILGLFPFLLVFMSELSRIPIVGSLSALQVGLQIIALWMLFTTPGKNWFKNEKGADVTP